MGPDDEGGGRTGDAEQGPGGMVFHHLQLIEAVG